MKKEINFKNAGCILCITFLLFFCIKCDVNVDCEEGKCFSLDLFKENLNESLSGNCVGYSYSVFFNDQLGGFGTGGYDRLDIDGGNELMSTLSRIQVGSMSKTITAVTTLKLLAEKSYSINERILKYLPPDWTIGPNILDISFKDLLRHESGFRECEGEPCTGPAVEDINVGACALPTPSNYDYLRCKVEAGVELLDMNEYRYQNINYQLLRVIIPKLAGINHLNSSNDIHTATKYVELVQNRIGNVNVNCTDEGGVYHYPFPPPLNTHGMTFGNSTSIAGAGGWFISALDYGHFLNALFKEEILNSIWLDTMIFNNLGCYSVNRDGVSYITHNGGLELKWSNCHGRMSGCWMRFENGLIVVLEVNSNITPDPEEIIRTAYNNSLVDE